MCHQKKVDLLLGIQKMLYRGAFVRAVRLRGLLEMNRLDQTGFSVTNRLH